MLKEDELPIFNWVWFGLYRSEGGLNGYTYGMDVFAKKSRSSSGSASVFNTSISSLPNTSMP